MTASQSSSSSPRAALRGGRPRSERGRRARRGARPAPRPTARRQRDRGRPPGGRRPPCGRRPLAAPDVAARKDDRCALVPKPLDDRRADPGRAPCDDRRKVSEPPHACDYLTERRNAVTHRRAERRLKSSDLDTVRCASFFVCGCGESGRGGSDPKGGRMEASPTTAPASEARGVTGSTELARNALGLPQILFCIVTGSAPLAAMMFNDPLSGLGIGIAVPAAFWLATISFTFFSVGYVEMARRVTTAGGYLLLHVVRLRPHHRPRHGGRHRRRLHALRGRASTA